MTGNEYSDLVARYIARCYGDRGVAVYREVSMGKSIIGKNRRIDVFVVHEGTQRALAIECKYQGSQGTADEKIPYTLNDIAALRVPACVVWAGEGFSQGVKHMLEGSHLAAYCLPSVELESSAKTRELDHIIAMTFDWWDVVLRGKKPISAD